MKRAFLALVLALLLVGCAPTRGFVAGGLNHATGALGVLTATGSTVTVTPVVPLGSTVLAISGDNLTVVGEACEPLDERATICTWATVTTPVSVRVTGRNVAVTASYLVAGERVPRHEILH